MVFFNCNGCGDALKKNQVEKHKFRCRQCQALSCVDCGKDFWGSDYQNHNKCMTENEKYCGKGYVPKVNKGEVKQEQWIEKVQAAIEKASSNVKLRGLLERLKDYPNIPRKKAKFENFLKNSLRVLSPALISQVWDLLMESTNSIQQKKGNEQANTENLKNNSKDICNVAENNDLPHESSKENEETVKLNKREKKEERQKKHKKEKKEKPCSENVQDEEVVPKKKKRKPDDDIQGDQTSLEGAATGKKRKRDEVIDETVSNNHGLSSKKKKKKKDHDSQDLEQVANGYIENCSQHEVTLGELGDEPPAQAEKKKKFKWDTTITEILKNKGEMSLKKLRRKVLQEFTAQDAANYNEENLIAKFNKKVSKLPQVCVKKERVRLK